MYSNVAQDNNLQGVWSTSACMQFTQVTVLG